MTTSRQIELWPGPLRPTRPYHAIYSTCCMGLVPSSGGGDRRCQNTTINGEFLCYACKDVDGYTTRLRQAQQKARQRCLEAYPVCKHCGRALTRQQIAAGETSHGYHRQCPDVYTPIHEATDA